jgi:hypothetical protein
MDDAPAFHDLFHFFVHPYSLIGHPSRDEILGGLRGRGWIGAAIAVYADAAGVPVASGRELLVDYLEASLDTSREIIDETEDGVPQLEARSRLLTEVRR